MIKINKENEVDTSYNGWKNYETWNVALWIQNDEGLYNVAKRFRNRGYEDFVNYMLEEGKLDCEDGKVSLIYYQTPDGVNWNDPSLDIEALDEMLADL